MTNPLIVAYEYVKDNGNRVIYAKDNNGKPQQSPSAGEIDFMKLHYADNTYHDHSNWVAIETGATPSVRPGDSRIEVTGKVLESSPNLRMKASLFEEIDQNGDFNPNTYCIVNFMDKSHHKIGNTNFFGLRALGRALNFDVDYHCSSSFRLHWCHKCGFQLV